jgi:hypothetical protein
MAYERQDWKIKLASRRKFGTARVSIASLQFVKGREIDASIVQHLMRVYEETKCKRNDPDNYIPILISSSDLRRALESSDLAQNNLKQLSSDGSFCYLHAAKNQYFKCLDGRHRISAALEFLDPTDQWWTADIFQLRPGGIILEFTKFIRTDLVVENAEDFIPLIRDPYHHQTRHSDGEIYREVRKYQKLGLEAEVDEMTTQLSPCKSISLKQLLKHDTLTQAFDALLPFPGLWNGLELGNIQRHLALRCDEVAVLMIFCSLKPLLIDRRRF